MAVETLLTPDQVAERLHLSPLTVVDWLRQGKLRGVKLSKHWRVREADLQAFITAHVVDGEESVTAPDVDRVAPPGAVEAPAPAFTHPQARKAAVVARLHDLRAKGLSLQAIANQLNAEGVPTLSGRGTWKPGAIGNLLAEGEAP
jgi:excisionase family DNA binding protein